MVSGASCALPHGARSQEERWLSVGIGALGRSPPRNVLGQQRRKIRLRIARKDGLRIFAKPSSGLCPRLACIVSARSQ
jgi:hypothetical protein